AQLSSSPDIQALVADVADRGSSTDARLMAFRVMSQAKMKELPAAWTASIVRGLRDRDVDVARQAVSAARQAPPAGEGRAGVAAALVGVGLDDATAVDVRLEALGAVQGGLTSVDAPLFDLLRASVAPAQKVATRAAAARVIEKAKLSRDQLARLVDDLRTAG